MHRESSERERREPGPAEGRDRTAGQDSRFLDLEASRVLHDGACRAAREALHRLLVRRIEARLEARMGERLDALADLAADGLVADLDASLEVEALVEERGRLRQEAARRLGRALFGERGGEDR